MTLFKVDVGWGQCGNNIIKNSNFILGTPCVNGSNVNGSSSFENGCVASWFRASETPHHAVVNPNSNSDVFCDIFNLPPVPVGTPFFPCIGGYEGIFQNLNILPDPLLTFNFSLDVAGLVCEHSNPGNIMEVSVTRDLTPNFSGLSLWTQMTMPRQSLITHTITDNVWQTLDIQFQINPSSNFNQIWIRNTFPEIHLGMFTFDNAILTCTTAALTDIRMNNIAGYTYDLSAINSSTISTFVKHHWTIIDKSNGNIIHSSALASPIYTFPAHGLYQVCLNIEDNNGCCSELFCKDLEIQNVLPICVINSSCIPIGKPNSITLLSQLLAGPNPIIPHQNFFGFTYAVSNVCLSVEGTLVIDVSQVSFNNTTWYMGSGAEIRVNNFTFLGSLTFNNSILEGCTDMWRGINMLTNGVPYYYYGVHNINLTNTTIKDAYRGVELGSGTRITASNSNFINNYIGCYIPPTFTHNQIFTGFGNCSFEFIGGMLPKYNGQPSYNERSYAGIITHDIVRLNVWGNINNSGSLFKNLIYGIRSNKSGLYIENTTFEFTDHDSYPWHVYGVFDENSKYPSGFYGNEFKNVNGIHSVNGTLHQNYTIYLNEFNSNVNKTLNGITCREGTNGSFNIIENDFYNEGRAISISLLNNSYNNLNIDLNYFNKDKSINEDLINIINTNPINSHVKARVRNNTIETNQGFISTIKINNSSSLVFLNNQFNGHENTIEQSNANDLFFKGNNVNSTLNGKYFIRNSMSSQNRYCCNNFNSNSAWADLYFRDGNTFNSRIVNNNISNVGLLGVTHIGRQPSRGNVFNLNSSEAYVQNFNADFIYYQANQFNVNSAQTGYRPQTASNFDDWFPSDGEVTECSDNSICDSSQYELQEEDDEEEWYAMIYEGMEESEAELAVENFVLSERVFDDSPQIYGDVQSWYNKLNLAKNYVLKYPHLSWETIFNNYSESENAFMTNDAALMLWADVERKKDALFSPSITQINHLRQLGLERKHKISSFHNSLEQSAEWNESHTIKSQELNHLTNQLNQLDSVVSLEFSQKGNSLLALVESLPSDKEYQSIRKRIWTLELLAKMGHHEQVTWNDIEFLNTSMYLCPSHFGKVGVEAFGVLRWLGHDVILPEWDDNCNEIDFRKNEELISFFNVYPNPTSGLITLDFNQLKAKKLYLFDNVGNTVLKMNDLDKKSFLTLDLSHLENGIYHCSVFNTEGTVSTKKIIIIK